MSNEGTVFKLTSQGILTSLYSFNHNISDGRNPTIGPLIRDRAGNLYGTTQNGGDLHCVAFVNTPGCGTVFELSAGGKETIVHSFSGGPTDGAYPLAGLVEDAAGNLYGTTYVGGTGCSGQGCGTVYKITPSGVETVLYSFTGGADGSNPYSVNLVIDNAGNLYGTTLDGGDLNCGGQGVGCGVVFKIDPAGNETVLYAFTGSVDGGGPLAGLVRDSQGNLYGTASSGGLDSCGVVFKVDPTGNETVLYNFIHGEVQPALQASSLLLDPAGNLYGTTLYGGSLQDGTVFEVSSQGVYTQIHSFDISDGLYPETGLIRDNAGNLYGTTSQGGNYSCSLGCGVIFKITP